MFSGENCHHLRQCLKEANTIMCNIQWLRFYTFTNICCSNNGGKEKIILLHNLSEILHQSTAGGRGGNAKKPVLSIRALHNTSWSGPLVLPFQAKNNWMEASTVWFFCKFKHEAELSASWGKCWYMPSFKEYSINASEHSFTTDMMCCSSNVFKKQLKRSCRPEEQCIISCWQQRRQNYLTLRIEWLETLIQNLS